MKTLEKIFGVVVSMFFATEGGVSLSEIGRIQAENKQQNDSFWSKVSDAVSGIYRKEISFVGAGDSTPRTLPGVMITAEEIGQYSGVAERNAHTANLMHAQKVYKGLQERLQKMDLRLFVVDALPEPPVRPSPAASGSTCDTDRFMDLSNIDEMIAALNPDVLAQFDLAFFQKANALNSRAATLGKLLSEQGSFFRELVKPLPKGEERLTQSGVIITLWEKNYSAESVEKLLMLREKLQAEYNDLQKQLNGCRKQIKDAVRGYNLEQERRYQADYGIYNVEYQTYTLEVERVRSAAETLRQQALQELAALRVRTE